LSLAKVGEGDIDIARPDRNDVLARKHGSVTSDIARRFTVAHDVQQVGPDLSLSHGAGLGRERTMTERLWARYAETVLIFATDPEIFVDLRAALPPRVREGLRAIGVDGRFAVLTAYNPRGENFSDADNNQRSAQLESELRSSGHEFVGVDACSPDRSHCECSVALQAPLAQAVEIARRYEQLAVFWFDGAEFWIEPVIANRRRVRLPARIDA
jgi:hypothetical protein